MDEQKARDNTIDFIRGLAVVLVVFGHCIQYGSGGHFLSDELYFENALFKFIYSFHMPLFALISGYLFYGPSQRPIRAVLERKVRSLLIPVFSWVTAEFAVRGGYCLISHNTDIALFVRKYISALVYSSWFLWAMFWLSLIVLLAEKVFRGRAWVYGAFLFLAVFVPAKYNLHLSAFLYPYFMAGFLFQKHGGIQKYRTLREKAGGDRVLLFVSGVLFGVLLAFYGHDSYIYTSKISLLGENGIRQLGIDVYRWAVGFAGSFAAILLCRMVCERWGGGRGTRILAYFGRISLGVYILNQYTNVYVLRKVTDGFGPSVLLWAVETAVSMGVYCAAVEIIKRVPVLGRCLLGGR